MLQEEPGTTKCLESAEEDTAAIETGNAVKKAEEKKTGCQPVERGGRTDVKKGRPRPSEPDVRIGDHESDRVPA
jgi:hypothetical protein